MKGCARSTSNLSMSRQATFSKQTITFGQRTSQSMGYYGTSTQHPDEVTKKENGDWATKGDVSLLWTFIGEFKTQTQQCGSENLIMSFVASELILKTSDNLILASEIIGISENRGQTTFSRNPFGKAYPSHACLGGRPALPRCARLPNAAAILT